jgi:hypothetical protein
MVNLPLSHKPVHFLLEVEIGYQVGKILFVYGGQMMD